MTLEDPFFVVKDEVCKALNKTRGHYRRWLELRDDATSPCKDELDWTTTELRNALRSIEWDLEDLEDTIGIVEKNPGKFKIDNKELSSRRGFIEQTREEVKSMKDKMSLSRGRDRDRAARQPLMENRENSPPPPGGPAPPTSVVRPVGASLGGGGGGGGSGARYSKLENEIDSPTRGVIHQQGRMLRQQDEQLDMLSDSLGTLKTVSRHIHSELDEQAVMLDEFGNELDNTETKLDSTMKKVAKVLHMSNDRRQWIAIGVLSTIMIVVILLFIYT